MARLLLLVFCGTKRILLFVFCGTNLIGQPASQPTSKKLISICLSSLKCRKTGNEMVAISWSSSMPQAELLDTVALSQVSCKFLQIVRHGLNPFPPNPSTPNPTPTRSVSSGVQQIKLSHAHCAFFYSCYVLDGPMSSTI